jgi:hypothetical protein
MQRYIFPPQMDFLKYGTGEAALRPFAMYIFEFEHHLTQQDLADIWQNLPPDIGTKFEAREATVSHDLLGMELFGAGIKADVEPSKGLTNDLRWMIFKVKQKGENNFYKTTLKSKDDNNFRFTRGRNPKMTYIPDYSYNWPYDFFSLVELIKLDTEITWGPQMHEGELPLDETQSGVGHKLPAFPTTPQVRSLLRTRNRATRADVSVSDDITAPGGGRLGE